MFNLDDELELLRQKHQQQGYVPPKPSAYSNENDLLTLLGAAGIGAGNMLNNTVFGGAGQILGTLGAGVEYISPFSGNQNDKVMDAMRLGVPYETAKQLYPNIDSWLTSLGKGSLEIQNAIAEPLSNARQSLLGDNPTLAAQIAEGTGSSLGFMLAGLGGRALAGGSNIAGALASGLTEALSESGGTLGEAYRQGRYDDGGLATANKSLAANAMLNFALDSSLGRFAPHTEKIRNPFTRFGVQTGEQIINELLQEPSQQVIEKAANRDLYGGEDFIPALGKATLGDENGENWLSTLGQVAPSVVGSTLLTQALLGGAGMAHPSTRQAVLQQFRNRNVDIEATKSQLEAQYDKRAKLQQRLEREKAGQNDQRVIDSLNLRIDKASRNIDRLNDALLPAVYEYEPQVLDEFAGRISHPAVKPNQHIDTQFRVVDVDSIITSHNDDLSLNENYPQQLQPRDRSKSASRRQIDLIAAHPDPALLGDSPNVFTGAPIIGNDNIAESGNGRIMALRRAYSQQPEAAKTYRQFIIDHAQEFGIDPQLAARMDKPVLVRVRTSDMNEQQRIDFTQQANESELLGKSPSENALNDVSLLDPSLIQLFDTDKSIGDNTEFVRGFIAKLPRNEAAALTLADGKPNKIGRASCRERV